MQYIELVYFSAICFIVSLLSVVCDCLSIVLHLMQNKLYTRMWANVQRDGRPAEYRWRPLFNAAKFG